MKIILGPVPCQRCRQRVVWNGWEWRNPSGNEHICETLEERRAHAGWPRK